jgi:hypothetical protein
MAESGLPSASLLGLFWGLYLLRERSKAWEGLSVLTITLQIQGRPVGDSGRGALLLSALYLSQVLGMPLVGTLIGPDSD